MAVVALCGSVSSLAQFSCPVPNWEGASKQGVNPGVGAVRAMAMWDPDGSGLIEPGIAIAGYFQSPDAATKWTLAFVDLNARTIKQVAPAVGGATALGITSLVVLPEGDLVVGGEFSKAGELTANNVARWDVELSEWVALGSGIEGTNEYVQAVALLPSGDVLVGGSFAKAGGKSATNLARWDGTQWHPFAGGTNDTVRALALLAGGDVVAGGSFGTAGGTLANRLARWNGSAWSPIGGGVFGDTVDALALMPNGDLVVAGQFIQAGSIPVANIARWDGTQWHGFGAGLSSFEPVPVRTLALLPNGHLVAGGDFTKSGADERYFIAQWDGSKWLSMDGGVDGSSSAAVFSLLPGPAGDLFVGGSFLKAGFTPLPDGIPAQGVARWNGLEWASLSRNVDARIRSFALAPNGDVFATGLFYCAQGERTNGVARWDGSIWHPLGTGISGEGRAIARHPEGDILVGGDFLVAGGVQVNRIARWDGTTWNGLGSGMNSSVYGICPLQSGDVIAVGAFTKAGGLTANRVARWDGVEWGALGTGVFGVNNLARAATESSTGDLYVGGAFTIAGSTSASRVARWDGTAWSKLGTGTNGDVWGLAIAGNGDVFASGGFTSAGGIPSSNIARWDGLNWSPLALGLFGGEVRQMDFLPNGDLVVAGMFSNDGSIDIHLVGRWNGADWRPLEKGISPSGGTYINDLVILPDGSVVVGGEFYRTTAGEVASYFARYGCEAQPLCKPDCDQSGSLNIDDFICYQTLYAIGDPVADCDESGGLDIDDFICFQTWYAIGC